HDDVLLEAAQVIDPGARGGLGEHTCGILERGSAEEALGFERGFGNTQQNWLRFGGFATHLLDALIFFLELEFVDLLTTKEGGIAGFSDAHLAEHLTDNDLDVFVVNGHTLKAVDFLHLVDEMFLQFLWTADVEDLVRVNRPFSQLLAFLDVITLEH